MPRSFDAMTLDTLRKDKEVGIRTSRNPSRPVIIWVVAADDRVFVRSFRGSAGLWYAAAVADGHAVLDVGGRQVPVRVSEVTDPAAIEAVSRAYRSKYADSPYAEAMVRAETLPTTLRLAPM